MKNFLNNCLFHPCFWGVLFCFWTSTLNGQSDSILNISMDVCLNGVVVSNNPSFVNELNYSFKLYKHKEEDLEEIDSIYYFQSDSMDITFINYQNFTQIRSIHIKCYNCTISCEQKNDIALGMSIEKIKLNYDVFFEGYLRKYYPELIKKKKEIEIPEMTIPFLYKFPRMKVGMIGVIMLKFKGKLVDELYVKFLPD